MRRTHPYIYTLLAGCLALSGSLAANADTTQVTTTTTTRSTLPTYVLPAAVSYIVVDPVTGAVKGNYDPVTHLVNGLPLSAGWVIVDDSTRAMVAMVDSYGNIVDVQVAPASETLLISLDTRRKELESSIAEAQAKGRLAAAQAEAMRQELNAIPVINPTSTITYSRAVQLGTGLNTITSRLVPVTEKRYSTVIAPQFVTIDGKLTLADDWTYKKLQLTRRIEDEYAYGHITKEQLLQFKSDLNALSAREASFRTGTTISDANVRLLSDDLNTLTTKLNSVVIVR